jgi:hypothetical protein
MVLELAKRLVDLNQHQSYPIAWFSCVWDGVVTFAYCTVNGHIAPVTTSGGKHHGIWCVRIVGPSVPSALQIYVQLM